MDHLNGFPNQQALVNMALNHQGMAPPHHLSPGPGPNPLGEVYGSSNALYSIPGQATFGQTPLNSQMHSIQPQPIDGYVLQHNSSHNQGLQQTFTMPAFGGTSHNDPYHPAFGYGM